MSNVDIIKDYSIRLWDDQDISVIEETFAADAIIHSPLGFTRGIGKMQAIIEQWHQGFPNLMVKWDDFIESEDKVVAQWRAHGMQAGDFLEYPASNKEVQYGGVTIYKLKDGKIVEYWAYVDMHTVHQQLQQVS